MVDLKRDQEITLEFSYQTLEMIKIPSGFEPHLIVFDFDGVFTDNTVETNANRIESVTCSKYDSLALSYFRKNNPNIKLLVLTSESNPSVSARCEKLKLPIKSSSVSKRSDLLESLNELSISPACTAFIGNDINDLELFDFLPVTACPNDSPAEVKARANHILEAKGGHGAVREFLELMSSRLSIAAHKPHNLSSHPQKA